MLLSVGCSAQNSTVSKQEAIPFEEGQLYAAAHLGYQQIDDLEFYIEQYLDSDAIPIHYLSDGDYYLIIPRYSGTMLTLFRNDITTDQSTLIFEDPDCRPFIIQCNVSDIFADATICLSYGDESVEFSPFISLKDGAVDIGEGLNLTRNAADM